MTTGEIPEEATPVSRGPEHSLRSTPELIVELQVRAIDFTLAAIAVVNNNNDVTQFVFAIDDDPLSTLNALVRAGGHPIGIVGARLGPGTIEYHTQPFAEYQHNPQAMAYLQTLRVPFLTLMRTHVDRMPDNPRVN
jgi:hypothetical protein